MLRPFALLCLLHIFCASIYSFFTVSIRQLTGSITRPGVHSPIHSFIHLYTHLFIQSSIHPEVTTCSPLMNMTDECKPEGRTGVPHVCGVGQEKRHGRASIRNQLLEGENTTHVLHIAGVDDSQQQDVFLSTRSPIEVGRRRKNHRMTTKMLAAKITLTLNGKHPIRNIQSTRGCLVLVRSRYLSFASPGTCRPNKIAKPSRSQCQQPQQNRIHWPCRSREKPAFYDIRPPDVVQKKLSASTTSSHQKQRRQKDPVFSVVCLRWPHFIL